MTREEFFTNCIDILLGEEFVPGISLFECNDIEDFVISNDVGNLDLSVFLDSIYEDIEIDELKTEQEIRDELNQLTIYRVPNSNTNLISLKAVERVLNLVFRGNRNNGPCEGK